jgi:hypothetical protein
VGRRAAAPRGAASRPRLPPRTTRGGVVEPRRPRLPGVTEWRLSCAPRSPCERPLPCGRRPSLGVLQVAAEIVAWSPRPVSALLGACRHARPSPRSPGRCGRPPSRCCGPPRRPLRAAEMASPVLSPPSGTRPSEASARNVSTCSAPNSSTLVSAVSARSRNWSRSSVDRVEVVSQAFDQPLPLGLAIRAAEHQSPSSTGGQPCASRKHCARRLAASWTAPCTAQRRAGAAGASSLPRAAPLVMRCRPLIASPMRRSRSSSGRSSSGAARAATERGGLEVSPTASEFRAVGRLDDGTLVPAPASTVDARTDPHRLIHGAGEPHAR